MARTLRLGKKEVMVLNKDQINLLYRCFGTQVVIQSWTYALKDARKDAEKFQSCMENLDYAIEQLGKQLEAIVRG